VVLVCFLFFSCYPSARESEECLKERTQMQHTQFSRRSNWTCPKLACGKANLSTVWNIKNLLWVLAKDTSTEFGKEKVRRRPRVRHPRKDITLSSNQPPLPTQRTTPWYSGPQLAVPFGFNTNKGEYRCSALKELQPLQREGSRVETANVRHVSSFGLDIHPLPSSPIKNQMTHADPRERYKICQWQSPSWKQTSYQTKWHWQVHYKALAFRPRRRTSSIAQHGRISRGREYSHHALQVIDLTYSRCSPNSQVKPDLP